MQYPEKRILDSGKMRDFLKHDNNNQLSKGNNLNYFLLNRIEIFVEKELQEYLFYILWISPTNI